MTFANPHLLWLLPVSLPAMLLFFWWSERTRQKLAAHFIQARLLPALLKGVSPVRKKIRAACLICAVLCLILALARPQWGYELEEVTQQGLDIVVAVDTSKSMLAQDIAPNRLARAKLAALDLMQQAKSDRLGLIAFAGRAFLQCPLTVDDSAFRQSVETLDVNVIPQGGTALAEAIDTALGAFKEGGNFKVLVLFTDGEDHDSGALEAAKRAGAAGMRIFTIGIGSREGELLPMDVRDEQNNVVKSRLNDELLRDIATETKGFYLPLQGANTIDTLYQQGLAPLPKSKGKEQWLRRPHEHYHWPLALAIALLVLEVFFPERRSETRRGSKREPQATGSDTRAPAAIAAALVLFALPNVAAGSTSSALRDYQSGKYGEALKQYEQLLQQKTDDPRLRFNAGAAAYRDHRFEEAAKYFDEALRSPDLQLQSRAYYNRGNAFYQLGEGIPDPKQRTGNWEKSLKDYDSALKLNPQDADAKFNYDFVKQRLEELKQQEQQQQQSQKNDQQQKQDQQQQNQQGQQSNTNQQQNAESQQQQGQEKKSDQQQAQDQKQSEEQKRQQQAEEQKQKEKQAEQQKQAQQASGQEKKDQEPTEGESAQAYANGEMTPEQAQQLLDAQKNNEKVLPFTPDKKQRRPASLKDW